MKYLADGRIVNLLSALPDGQFVVELGHDFGDDPDAEPFFEGTQIVKAVYDKPPRDAIDQQIALLLAHAADLRTEISDLQSNLRAMESAHKERLEYLRRFEPLAQIEQFVRGEITHYVLESEHDVRLLAFDDAHDRNDYVDKIWNGRTYAHPLRMLQLFGHPKYRTVTWELSDRSYDSRNSYVCHPFTDESAALAKAKTLVEAKVASLMSKEGYMHGANYLIEAARKLGIEPPANFLARWKASEAQSLASQIAEAEKRVAELRAKQVAA